MHFASILSSFILISVTVCGAVDFSAHPYIKPKATDLRGPCPGMNTLANHGFIPRNGRGLTVKNVLDASIEAYNVQNDLLLFAAKMGFAAGGDLETFTLADIRLHDNIEHDASISREDFFSGDNFHFNASTFTTMLNANPGKDFYDSTSAGQVQKARLEIARTRNPQLKNTAKEFGIRSTESSFYLTIFGNITTTQAPKKFVQVFFQEERLPIAEGWKRSEIPINADNSGPIIQAIAAASEWTPDAGAIPTITFFGNNTV